MVDYKDLVSSTGSSQPSQLTPAEMAAKEEAFATEETDLLEETPGPSAGERSPDPEKADSDQLQREGPGGGEEGEAPARGKEFKCNNCDRKYANRGGLLLHNRSVHEKIRYDCEFCDKSLSRVEELKNHINYVHLGKENEFKCDICRIFFRDKGNLNVHIRTCLLYTSDAADD